VFIFIFLAERKIQGVIELLVEEIVRKMDEVFVNEIKNIEGRLKSKRELHFLMYVFITPINQSFCEKSFYNPKISYN